MRLWVMGDGAREEAIRREALARGHSLTNKGFDCLLLPLPRSGIERSATFTVPDGAVIVCGRTDDEFDELARARGWYLLRILDDEQFTLDNARITAEGALRLLMGAGGDDLYRKRCLVIGFGRIGKHLTRMLRALGAFVTVAARNPASREAAGDAVSIEGMDALLPEFDFILSTVPAPLLTERNLPFVRSDAVVIDLASPPYGIDFDAAGRLHKNVSLESALPARYAPRAAARAVVDFLDRRWPS